MIDSFVAKVESVLNNIWTVTPQIINDDGNQHPTIEVKTKSGITPKVGDFVQILTMKNNLDFSNINKFFSASYANGIIIGILQSQDGKYYLTGDYDIDGNLIVSQSLEVKGNSRNLTTYTELNSGAQSLVSGIQAELVKIQTAITGLGGVYTPGTLSLDISSAETNNIKTGPE